MVRHLLGSGPDHLAPQVAEAATHLFRQATIEHLLVKDVATCTGSQDGSLDLRTGEPSRRVAGEEEEPRVAWHFVIVDAADDVHLPIDGCRVRFVE